MSQLEYIGDVSSFNQFALCGVEERHEAGERILYGPVGEKRATFFALECKGENIEDKHVEFDKGLTAKEITQMLLQNEHIAKCGIVSLY